MLRSPLNDAEIASAVADLSDARRLMASALNVLDVTPVATECDAHLDLAIQLLDRTIEQVQAGDEVFRLQKATH